MQPIVGVSACLLGDLVRYDGQDQSSSIVQEQLSAWLEWQPFCPEVAAGMGVPRPTTGLYQNAQTIELRINPGQNDGVTDLSPLAQPKTSDSQDLTSHLINSAESFFKSSADLCGYVFMQRSPSCAVGSAPLLGGVSRSEKAVDEPVLTSGVFAAELQRRQPYLPLIQEVDLHEPEKLDMFLTAVFALQRLNRVLKEGDFAKLLQFHSRYKYLLMAHSVPAYKSLGKLLAKRCKDNQTAQLESYRDGFMQAINSVPTRGGVVNALLHMMGYIKDKLSTEQRSKLLSLMEAYRLENANLQQPVECLQAAIDSWGSDYIKDQFYWQPHPLSERLRSQI